MIFTSRPLPAHLQTILEQLQPGQRIRLTQTVRVGSSKTWQTTVEGSFRELRPLATGVTVDRVAADDIIVATVHFVKDNQELSSVALDENSRIDIVGGHQ